VTMRPRTVVVGVAGSVLGLLTWLVVGRVSVQGAVEFGVGLVLLVGGLAVWERIPGRTTGPLLAAAGLAWFAGDLPTVGWPVIAAVTLASLHRGLLVHAILSHAAGRLEGAGAQAVTVAVYLGPLAASPAAHRAVAAGLLLAVAAVAAVAWFRERAAPPRRHLVAFQASLVLLAVPVLQSVAEVVLPLGDARRLGAIVYVVGVAAAAVLLIVDLLRSREGDVADVIVELAQRPRQDLREELEAALGDPTVQIGYATGRGDLVDEAGRPLSIQDATNATTVTPIVVDGEEVGVVVHAASIRDDPAVITAISAAMRLVAQHVRLQAQVRAQITQVTASRRRLLTVADEERRRLSSRLGVGAHHRLDVLGDLLVTAEGIAGATSDGLAGDVRTAVQQFEHTVADLRELARGLHPVALQGGLVPALTALVERSPVPATLHITAASVPAEVETAVYYVCAEALANVAKHAPGASATVVVRGGDILDVVVSDDGAGGADHAAGTGLVGLNERVEALGGEFVVDSAPGAGTRVHARLPLARVVGSW
jgi:signal transduction histidine kinase